MTNKLYFIDKNNDLQSVNIVDEIRTLGHILFITDKGEAILNWLGNFDLQTVYFDSKLGAIECGVSTLKAKIQSNIDKINLIKDENDELYHSINKLNVQKVS